MKLPKTIVSSCAFVAFFERWFRMFFIVHYEQGPHWLHGVPMRKQRLWEEHAGFMDALRDAHFVILGGIVGSEDNIHKALVAIQA